MQLCKERKICVEVCPISNELLVSFVACASGNFVTKELTRWSCSLLGDRTQRYTGSMPAHPLPVLLNSGVPVSLSCDDPAIFGNFGREWAPDLICMLARRR